MLIKNQNALKMNTSTWQKVETGALQTVLHAIFKTGGSASAIKGTHLIYMLSNEVETALTDKTSQFENFHST